MPRLAPRANVGYGFPNPTAGDRGAGQQAMWDALQALGIQESATSIITASRALTIADCGDLLIDATAGNIALTLPATSSTLIDNAVFCPIRLDNSANNVTLVRGGADTIEGATQMFVVPGQRSAISMPAGSTTWRRIADSHASGITPFLFNYLRITADITASGTVLTIPATQAASSDNAAMMTIAATFTKTTGIFVAGTGNGGLDTGAMAAFTEYFLYQVRNTSTGVVDYTFSTNSSAPAQTGNLAGFTQSRRLPILLRTGATATQWAYVLNQHLLPAPQILGVYDMAGIGAVNIFIPSQYRNISLRGEDFAPSTNGQDLRGQLQNNGTAIVTSSYAAFDDYTASNTANTITTTLTTSTSFSVMGGLTAGGNETGRWDMEIDTLNANRTNFNVRAQYQSAPGSGASVSLRSWIYYTGAAARNGIRLFSGSNFTRGRITVMGTL